MTTTQPQAGYTPGVCNINTAETAYRRKAGYMGLGLVVLIALPLFLLDLSRFTRIILFVPVFLAAISFLQAKNRFCVAYAASGMQNATGNDMTGAKQVSAADRLKDKVKSNKMYLQAAGIAALATVIFLLIP